MPPEQTQAQDTPDAESERAASAGPAEPAARPAAQSPPASVDSPAPAQAPAARDVAAGEQPAGEQPAGAQPAGEQPVGEQPAGRPRQAQDGSDRQAHPGRDDADQLPDLPDFGGMLAQAAQSSIELLNDVELNVKIELGRTEMTVDEILRLTSGSVVELDKLAGDPVDVLVNEQLVARGEVLVVNDNFCVRINEIVKGIAEKAAATGEQ